MYISIIVELNYKKILLAILYIHQFTFISSSVDSPTLIRELYRIKKKRAKGVYDLKLKEQYTLLQGQIQ